MEKDLTNARRQAAAIARLLENGGRRVTVRVPPTLNVKLTAECERKGESANATILRILDAYLPRVG